MTDHPTVSLPSATTRIHGDGQWDGWWVPPLAIGLVTVVLIIAAAVIQGSGVDSTSAAANQTVTRPTSAP